MFIYTYNSSHYLANILQQRGWNKMKEESKDNMITFEVNRKIYPMEMIFGAGFIFIDRCYVYIDRNGNDKIKVTLKGKTELNESQLEALSGEFNNELLNQALRKKIGQSNRRIREYIVSRALFSAEPVDDEEEEFEEAPESELGLEEDFLDDPLQIAVPWDEKYGADKKAAPASAATECVNPEVKETGETGK
jgi:His-Xaa-Ser system protein HxsD